MNVTGWRWIKTIPTYYLRSKGAVELQPIEYNGFRNNKNISILAVAKFR